MRLRYGHVTGLRRVAMVWNVQRDHKAGASYTDLVKSYKRSRDLIWKLIKTKLEVKEIVEARDAGYIDNIEVNKYLRRVGAGKLSKKLNPLQFIEDKEHLNFPLFPMQRLIIKAFYGLKLNQDELKILEKLQKERRTTWKPGVTYRELVIVGGMKGGKTPLASAISLVEYYNLWKLGDFREHYHMPPSKEIFITNVATNKNQARDTIFAETEARIENSPFFNAQKFHQTAFNYRFDDKVIIRSGHSNSSGLVGPAAKCVLFDELARFTTREGRSSAHKVYYALIKAVDVFGMDGKIVSISSPVSENDIIMTLYNKSKKVSSMLGFILPTWEMNPYLPFDGPVMQSALEKSPEDFWRDNGCKPHLTVEKYYRDRNRIDQMYDRSEKAGMKNPIKSDGSFEDWFKADSRWNYNLHLDPAVNNCSFGMGMTHKESEEKIVVDLAYGFKAKTGEIDYDELSMFLESLLERFPNLRKVTYDTYMAVSLKQKLEKKGVKAEFKTVDKLVHDFLKIEGIYSKRVYMYRDEVFNQECRELDLINGRRVDHPDKFDDGTTGTKDVADAVAGSVYSSAKEDITAPASANKEDSQGNERVDLRSDYNPSYRRSFKHGTIFDNIR